MKTLADQHCQAELVRRLRTLPPDAVRRWGSMSAPQMVCHLGDACRMALGGKPVSVASSRVQRTLVKWIALYAPLRWPAGVPTRPEIDQQHAGTRPANFAADIAEVETLLARIAETGPQFDWPIHPIFGRLSRAAWMRWAYLHTDHHLRQFGA
jgi:Protein of unknown function (DUF1569)